MTKKGMNTHFLKHYQIERYTPIFTLYPFVIPGTSGIFEYKGSGPDISDK